MEETAWIIIKSRRTEIVQIKILFKYKSNWWIKNIDFAYTYEGQYILFCVFITFCRRQEGITRVDQTAQCIFKIHCTQDETFKLSRIQAIEKRNASSIQYTWDWDLIKGHSIWIM
jgi:hypothetical protein